ncbi:MAG: PQQ-dependent sugar dehydrogenase [Pseudomonadota bacterium]
MSSVLKLFVFGATVSIALLVGACDGNSSSAATEASGDYSAAVRSKVEDAVWQLPESLATQVLKERVLSTDYAFDFKLLQAEGYSPARVSALGDGFVFSTSLQNLEDMALTDFRTGDVHLLGKLPLTEVEGGENWVWPRILNIQPLHVSYSEHEGRQRPISADLLMFVSVFDGAPDRRCQFVFVRKFRADLSGQGKHEFLENWFESPCVPEEVGTNHSWESGGGLAILPPSLRKDPDNLEFVLTLGHFHAVHQNDWFDSLPAAEKNLITSAVHISAPGEFEIIATGLRNSQGLVVVPTSKSDLGYHLLASDHGPYSGDEINRIERGNFYGWPDSSFGRRYDERDRYVHEFEGLHHEATRPIYYFSETSVAFSPLINVRSDVFRGRWSGLGDLGLTNLIGGAMVRGSLYRLVYDGQKILTTEEIIIGFRPRSIVESGNHIIVGSDDGILGVLTPVEIREEGSYRPISETSSEETSS